MPSPIFKLDISVYYSTSTNLGIHAQSYFQPGYQCLLLDFNQPGNSWPVLFSTWISVFTTRLQPTWEFMPSPIFNLDISVYCFTSTNPGIHAQSYFQPKYKSLLLAFNQPGNSCPVLFSTWISVFTALLQPTWEFMPSPIFNLDISVYCSTSTNLGIHAQPYFQPGNLCLNCSPSTNLGIHAQSYFQPGYLCLLLAFYQPENSCPVLFSTWKSVSKLLTFN